MPHCRHAVVRVFGHGLHIVPSVPAVLERRDGALEIEVTVGDGAARFARVIPSAGGYRSQLDQHTASLGEVADVELCPGAPAAWRLETTQLSFPWPDGFRCHLTDPAHGAVILELLRDPLFAFIQMGTGCDRVLTPLPHEAMVAQGRSWEGAFIEVAYHHDGVAFRQLRHLRRIGAAVMATTVQHRPEHGEGAYDLCRQLAAGVRPTAA